MKRIVGVLLFLLTFNVIFVAGQNKPAFPDKIWREIDDAALQQKSLPRTVIPNSYRTFTLDKAALQTLLGKAPMEFTEASRNNSLVITLPLPDGKFARFLVENSPIFEPELAVRFPDINTYRGKGIDDPTATARIDLTPQGFHAMILSASGTILVDPYAVGDTRDYISYSKNDVESTEEFTCHVGEGIETSFTSFSPIPDEQNVVSGTTLRTYRLALAATGEYTQAVGGGTVSGALAAMTTIMNRVNGVYEREVAIRMILIANTTSIIYTNGATDPYDNNDGETMLAQNQSNIDSVIGTANYDIGHVFSTGGGGIASLRAPCNSSTKARGVTGLPNPVGDAFAIDFVAHEMGHQFGGNHTFNGTSGSCFGNRASGAAYEPGSGITIMGYAGICNNQDLALHSIDTFHVKSIEEIVAFSTGSGNVCAVSAATGNTPPTVTVEQTGLNIPKQTPFYLSANATDENGDSLTYDWQEYDLGAETTSVPNSDADGNQRPLFRPYLPVTSGIRYFPSLQYILNNANVPPSTTGGRLTGEILPAIARTMIFQVTVRDNRANGGGVRSRAATVNIDDTSGPFVITAPETNVSWAGNSTQTVTWNVANTTNATINAQNVKISLSTDGGNTFPTVILASTPNDGTQTITVPNINTTQARIKVEAVDNIFFDISGANFTINATTVALTHTRYDFDGDGKADVSVFRPASGAWYLLQSQAGASGIQFGLGSDKLVPADYDGDGKTDVAVYRAGTWYLNRSQAGFTGVQFGAADDIPQPADYDGDGKAELAVFRPSNGTWYFYNLANNQVSAAQFGQNGDRPVPADFDGDGKADLAVFRPSAGTWYLQRSQLGFTAVQFGEASDKAVPADYDGDGKADLAVFRPSTGTWFTSTNPAINYGAVVFGQNGDVPTPADYDGDGKADLAIFRDGTWYLRRSQAGLTGVAFGAASDLPIPNVFVR